MSPPTSTPPLDLLYVTDRTPPPAPTMLAPYTARRAWYLAFGSTTVELGTASLGRRSRRKAASARPGRTTWQALERLAQPEATRAVVPVIFITALDDPGDEARAMQGGAIAFLRKPFDDEALLAAIPCGCQVDADDTFSWRTAMNPPRLVCTSMLALLLFWAVAPRVRSTRRSRRSTSIAGTHFRIARSTSRARTTSSSLPSRAAAHELPRFRMASSSFSVVPRSSHRTAPGRACSMRSMSLPACPGAASRRWPTVYTGKRCSPITSNASSSATSRAKS